MKKIIIFLLTLQTFAVKGQRVFETALSLTGSSSDRTAVSFVNQDAEEALLTVMDSYGAHFYLLDEEYKSSVIELTYPPQVSVKGLIGCSFQNELYYVYYFRPGNKPVSALF